MGMINSDEMFSEETEDEYFDLINKKIETTKVSSQSLLTSPSLNHKKQIYDNKPLKNWKKVLLHFLEKQNKLGITWCKELFQIIKAYQFSSEEKYLDYFFWQKFELSTKPTCLNTSPSSSLSNSLSSTQSQLSEEKIEKLSSSKSLNLSDLTSSQYLSELSKNEYEKNKLKLKEYITIFQSHLKNNDHPISICLKLFVEIFSKEIQLYTEEIEEIKNLEEKIKRAKIVSEAICQQLVFFLFKLQKCFGYMYSPVFNFKYYQEEKEEFTKLFSSLFFSHKKLYDLILNLLTLEKEKEIYDFCKHILYLNESGIKPKNFGINEKFCLDEETALFQLNFIQKNNLKISEDDINKINSVLNNKNNKEQYIPYKSTIELIKKIKMVQSPIDKMEILYSMGNDVIENINTIWKPLENFLPKNFLSVDGDELIKIFGYILIKSKMPEILSHLSFVKNFTTKDTKTSMIGYYYTTIEAGVILAKKIEEKNYFGD